jgi:hypothetical protein
METIAQVLHLTEKMLQASRSGEWDMLTILQQQREQLLHSSTMPAKAPLDPDIMLAMLRETMVLNEEIVSIARSERQHRQIKLESLRRGQHAVRCYEKGARII